MKIAIASDHGGFELKQNIIEYLSKKNVDILNLGTDNLESVDYPIYADKLVNSISKKEAVYGILICGTGIGISIRANRHKDIRAAILYDDNVAEMTRKHNNANVMVFGGRTMNKDDVFRRIDIFLNTEFEGGRHQKRIEMLDI